jgi:hypothetical protein
MYLHESAPCNLNWAGHKLVTNFPACTTTRRD